MIELWKSLPDDQIALAGCAAALCVAGTIMSLSYYLGRGRIASAAQRAGKPSIFDPQAGCTQPAAALTVTANRRDAA